MYATRIPAMQRADIQPQDVKFPADLLKLPDGARQVADNYNHLMEQPTIFYAIVFYIFLVGHTDLFRCFHTLIQCTVNIVNLRFTVFALSTLLLMAMAAREVVAVL